MRERLKNWWDNWSDLFAFIGVAVGGVVLLVVVIMGGDYYWSRHTCNQRADQMGLQHHYGFWTDCMVRFQDSDPWVPLDDVRVQAGELYTEEETDG